MKKYIFYIIGAGLQGSAAASILSKLDFTEKIILADIDEELLKKVYTKISSDKIVIKRVDASNIDDITDIDEEVDIILNFTPPRFNLNIMISALRLGSHYLDTASGPDLNLKPIDEMVALQFNLDKEYREAGLKALISCGYTPGLSNVIARYLVDKLDTVEEIRFRAAYAPARDLGPLEALYLKYSEIMSPTWSPEVSFLYRATKPVTYSNGRYIRHEPFGKPERYKFPEPIGDVVTVLVDHEEPVTIPRFISNLKYVDYKNMPDIIAYAFIKLGFAEDKYVNIGGIRVKPRDVLLKLLKPPVNYFLEENEHNIMKDTEIYYESLVAEVRGYKDGLETTLKATIVNEIPPINVEERLTLYRRFGTLHFLVSLPAVTGAKLILDGEGEYGVLAPEALDPRKFIETMKTFGYLPRIIIEEKSKLI